MSGEIRVSISVLRTYIPGFDETTQCIYSTVDLLRSGLDGITDGQYISGDDDNGTKFAAVFAKRAGRWRTHTCLCPTVGRATCTVVVIETSALCP
ncbi:hypothetical protein LWC34_54405 [Kibdelosporangium philippinense]|uniref:Uncharacterized protein n=1 Tax=Kibdelosporangium philippinense TaxID=211113 RepID=A0ABS8ZVW4_9PSEU|nr:hypothetical protein [Kibdelosporangium philippinense]MCE7011752.1 hypothetical protein [Kibdelosporangium philippinense]